MVSSMIAMPDIAQRGEDSFNRSWEESEKLDYQEDAALWGLFGGEVAYNALPVMRTSISSFDDIPKEHKKMSASIMKITTLDGHDYITMRVLFKPMFGGAVKTSYIAFSIWKGIRSNADPRGRLEFLSDIKEFPYRYELCIFDHQHNPSHPRYQQLKQLIQTRAVTVDAFDEILEVTLV